MKISHATLVATAVPLLLTSLRVSAGELHWSAAIGSGYAARTTVTYTGETNADAPRSSVGVSVSPHWTARIGTGTPEASTNSTPNTKQSLTSGTQPVVAAAHWTSRIGTGRASDSTSPIMHASSDQRTVKQ